MEKTIAFAEVLSLRTHDIKNYKYVARDLAGYEVYGDLSDDGKRLVRPGLTIVFQEGSLRPNDKFDNERHATTK